MKYILIAFFSTVIFVSCGDGGKTETKTGSTADTVAATPAPAEPTVNPEVTKGLDLAAKSDCFTCHKLNEVSTGPSYAAVAAKYKSEMPAIADTLASKIIKGGSGVWGAVPMTSHPTMSVEDAKAIVSYIMTIN